MPYHQFSIQLLECYHESLSRYLIERGCLGAIDQPDVLVAFFPLTVDPRDVSRELEIWKALMQSREDGCSLAYEHSILPDADWNESWKSGFRPMDIGNRFTIMPPWEVIPGDRIPLIIDPGMAFGTGHHETTRSCLILMERFAGQVNKNRFLDLGTGTGLLALAALKLGFQVVEGIDTDPLAIEAGRRNMALNQAEQIVLREGSLSAAAGLYNMIAANLISGTLISIAGDLAKHLEHDGIAVLSGILYGQQDEVMDAMNSAGLGLEDQLRDGKWISLAVKHESPSDSHRKAAR
mgnify:FL=1